MTGQSAEISWTGDVPVSNRFQDPYYSLADGLAETAHVFLNGNGLPERFRPGFHVGELGFGTGLNMLAAYQAARAAGALPLHYTGFEAHPIAPADMARALSAFPDLAEEADWLVAAWKKGPDLRREGLEARVILGDAAKSLPGWSGTADAWFLDGFAPARNPGMWTPDLMEEVARHTAPRGTAATYSAAGSVRRALATAGFAVTRRPGYDRKRHMTVAVLP